MIMAKIIFVNSSPNRDGNTAAMMRKLMDKVTYETLNLIDYKIYPLGQIFSDDQFDEVMRK